jgi:small GTP-binding protein
MTAEPGHHKVVLLGDSGVGKTALVERVTEDIFQNSHVPTVGAQFVSLELGTAERKCILELWDTAGQEVFRSLVGFYARDAEGAFILFDVTNRQSFESLAGWLDFIRENSPQAILVVFANKIDLAEERTVPREESESFASEKQIVFFEGSAKTGENVRDAFEKVVELVSAMSEADKPPAVQLESGKKRKGKCPC